LIPSERQRLAQPSYPFVTLRFRAALRVFGWRFGFSVIGGVAVSAFNACSNDSGASETGCDLVGSESLVFLCVITNQIG
jgi:hypothetical protein